MDAGSLTAGRVFLILGMALALKLDGEYEYINLEEDLGLEGLRRAKALYSPVGRLEVYEASRE